MGQTAMRRERRRHPVARLGALDRGPAMGHGRRKIHPVPGDLDQPRGLARRVRTHSRKGVRVLKTWADFRIDLRGATSGETDVTCPECSHTRKKKTARCLSVNVDKGVWN